MQGAATTEPTYAATEARVLRSLCSEAREGTAMRRPHTAVREWALLGTTREKAEQQQRPSTAKNEWANKNYLKTNCSYIPHFPYETLSLISLAARKLKPKWCLPHLHQLFRNVCQPFPELTSCLASFYFTFILIYPAIILSCYIFRKLLFFFKWIINKRAYLRYTLWNCLKLVCPLHFIVFSLNVLALLLRNKWKHMCKTNHSLSFQICHELPDQREMRKATLQTGPQGSLNQASLSGAGKDRFPPSLVWFPKAPAWPITFALIIKGRKHTYKPLSVEGLWEIILQTSPRPLGGISFR